MSKLSPPRLYRHDFLSFVRFVFHELYPGKEFVDSWHVDVIADGLMQCAPGGERRLILNVPPRYLKSLCASIAWPLFIMTHHPGLRIFVCAGTRDLAAEFNELRERLFKSRRFQQVFEGLKVIPITGGYRFNNGSELVQTVVGKSQIGRGADIIIIDDPISPLKAREAKEREAVNAWYDAEVLPRLNNKRTAAMIVVMQRLAENDLCGHLLAGNDSWRHLSLSAVAKEPEVWRLANGTVYRRGKGDILCPLLEDKDALLERLSQIGGLNFYGQYLQAPTTTLDGSNMRPFRRPTLVCEGWKPGMPTISTQPFAKRDIAVDIRCDYFGEPDPDELPGYREQTEEEFAAEFFLHQTTLIASCREDSERRRTERQSPLAVDPLRRPFQ